MRKSIWDRFAIAVLCLSTVNLSAESFTGGDTENPFENAAPPAQGDGSEFFGNTSTIQDSTAGSNANGREFKAGEAQRQGNVGAAVATATGAALTSAAMAAFAALQFARGARLLGMAGMEFGQAAADMASAKKNGDQRTMLLDEAGQSGKQGQANPLQAVNDAITPENRAMLESQGVNVDALIGRLASGQIRTGTDALAAVGKNPEEFSPDVNDFSMIDMSEFISVDPEPLGEMTREAIGFKDDATTNPNSGQSEKSGTGSGGGAIGGVGGIASAQGAPNGSPQSAAAHAAAQMKAAQAASAKVAKKDGVAPLSTGLDGPAMLFNAGRSKNTIPLLDRAELLAIGVTKMRGQNIFRVANRNYRSFSKWRGMRAKKSQRKPATRDIASF